MKKIVLETIDGSIKNIIQLKTLDNSLEFSQMFDALEDTPRDFQTKLIDALNSLGETMQIPPVEAFNKVLCRSDEKNEGLRKKLYNWWRAFFEVLGKVVGNMPSVKSAEFTEKIDDLMAEIMKSGDAEASTEEDTPVMEGSARPRFKKGDYVVVRNGDDARVLGYYRDRVDKTIWYQVWVMDGNRTTEFRDDDVYASRREYEAKYLYEEEYEQATKEDEDKMMADMDFAVQHLGEVANKVKAVVNFINPYCEKTFNEENIAMKKPGRYGIGDHVLYKGEECVVIDVDEDLRNDEEIYQVSRDSDKVDGLSFNDWVTWDEIEPAEGFAEEEVKKNNMKKTNETGASEFWKAMDDVDDLERKGYWSGKFKVGDKVNWIEPDEGYPSDGWTIEDVTSGEHPSGDDLYIISRGKSSVMNISGSELRPAKMANEVKDASDDWVTWDEMVGESDLENELDKGDDGWVEIGQPVGESKPVELESDGFQLFKPGTDVIATMPWGDEEGTIVKAYKDHYEVKLWDQEEIKAVGLTKVRKWEEINEGTDWKDLTEKLTAVELADSIDGWEDRSKNLVVMSAYEESDDAVVVNVRTIVDDRQKIVDMVEKYLLGNVENWQIDSISESKQGEDGRFYTEVILKPKYDEVLENNDEEVTSGDVKDGEKQVTQDGETKTLVAGEENKKPVCEMTIEQEIDDPWKLSELLWSQGKENLEELLRSELVGEEEIMQMLEDTGVRNLTNINDLFAFDFPSVLDSLGLDGEAWSQNLEFKRK